jgi:phosphotransferase system  glucose/maltose/N-acetylglucosamine-specific IIC component
MQEILESLIRLIQTISQEKAVLIVSVLALLVVGFALYVVLATLKTLSEKGGNR